MTRLIARFLLRFGLARAEQAPQGYTKVTMLGFVRYVRAL